MTIDEAFQLAVQHHQSANFAEAAVIYRQILAQAPDYADAWHMLGVLEFQSGNPDVAVASIRKAIALASGKAHFHCNLGAVLGSQGHLPEAVAEYRRSLELHPTYAKAHNNLGGALRELGRIEEAVAAHRRAVEAAPDDARFRSNLLLALHYVPGLDAAEIFAAHRCWDEMHGIALTAAAAPHGNDRQPERRLRIGYVSPDFREHPLAFFLEGLLASHDRRQVELFCYADSRRVDGFTQRLRQNADHWRETALLPDADFAQMVRRDAIDILVDLAGHTADNRLLVFARKPAPVQVTWLGYCDTTGLGAMDYRLTDAHSDLPGTTEHLHTEKLWRLPETFACFRPSELSPPISTLPVLARGKVTFGSFHTLAKLNDPLLELWAEILRRVADSQLLIVGAGLEEASVRQRFVAFFAGRGIDAQRVEFRGKQSLADYFALHSEVDVLLDSHPFSGHTVSCHALWIGVPVVTLSGATHCSRMVTSVLSNVGRPEWIAATPEEYVSIATGLASDLQKLAEIRVGLRSKMAASPLTDGARFARNVEQAYREMWRAWCARATEKGAP